MAESILSNLLGVSPVSGALKHELTFSRDMLRDYFAAQALPAVMAIYATANGYTIGAEHFPRNCAAHAYKLADALLDARTK